MKSAAKNELRKIWNAKLTEAGYDARYITSAEQVEVHEPEQATVTEPEVDTSQVPEVVNEPEISLELEEMALAIYDKIEEVDKEQGTENFLPIYFIRDIYSDMSRDELDECIYYLMRNDLIDVSTLQEASHYTPKQIDAGIVQIAGGPLFFLEIM